MQAVQHRGKDTQEKYCGLPVHAAEGVHQKIVELLISRLGNSGRIADLAAGHGALSLRMLHAGFDVTAFDLDTSEWQVKEICCYRLDLEKSLETIADYGPFDAICALEVIEHLENPRLFLKRILDLARPHNTLVVISTPNPLDTFSCITMFTRGIFNWFSTEHYLGGGHISILPCWLIKEHLKWLGVSGQEWFFIAPYKHPGKSKRLLYELISRCRRWLSKSDSQDFFEGQTAVVVVSAPAATLDVAI